MLLATVLLFVVSVDGQQWVEGWRSKLLMNRHAGAPAGVAPLRIFQSALNSDQIREIITGVKRQPVDQMCSSQRSMKIPSQLHSDKPESYRFVESTLQIFLNFSMPCDGIIRSFNFISATTEILGLHIGVFRQSCGGVFHLVSDSYLHGHKTGTQPYAWISWADWKTVAVKRGDVIGVFYDRFAVDHRSVSVVSHRPDDSQPRNTLVFLQDAFGIAKENGCLKTSEGRITRRIPALYVELEPMVIRTQIVQTPEQGPFLLLPIAEAKLKQIDDEGGSQIPGQLYGMEDEF